MTTMGNLWRLRAAGVRTAGAAAALAAWGSSAWAQAANTCEVSLTYAAVVAPPVSAATPVPGLGMLGVGALGAVVAVMAWRQRHQGGLHRMMAVVGVAAAVSLSAMGGGSLVNAVRAAAPLEFSSATGGSVATTLTYADPAPVETVLNTSGARIRITANGNAAETGTCAVNSIVEPGASCTTQASACTPPILIEVQSEPIFDCTKAPEPFIGLYNNNEAGPFQGTLMAYAPLVLVEPSFSVNDVATEFAYVRNETAARYVGGNLDNAQALRSGVASVTATAPAGYVFGPDNTSTKTWSEDYICGAQSGITPE
jgi:hypothetical protein